jgi:hypothetical protein
VNGRPLWKVTRAQGLKIAPGGTLIVGREQDCVGGCFDSAEGAAGRVSRPQHQEYGVQVGGVRLCESERNGMIKLTSGCPVVCVEAGEIE